MRELRDIITSNSLKKRGRHIYVYTDKPENSMLLYNDLVKIGYQNYGFETPTSTKTYHIFSVNDDREIIHFDIKFKKEFNVVTHIYVEYKPHKLLLIDNDYILVINYDYLLRLAKIKKIRFLCMTQYPKIKKFDRDTIHSCHVPRNPTKYFYEEVYNKGVLRKENLKVGSYYYGRCRNANVAMWDGNVFIYMRSKWGSVYPEEINHLQDDNGYDLFVPIEEVEPNENEKIKTR